MNFYCIFSSFTVFFFIFFISHLVSSCISWCLSFLSICTAFLFMSFPHLIFFVCFFISLFFFGCLYGFLVCRFVDVVVLSLINICSCRRFLRAHCPFSLLSFLRLGLFVVLRSLRGISFFIYFLLLWKLLWFMK